MRTRAQASLTDAERRTLDRFVERADWARANLVYDLLEQAAAEEGASPSFFSVHVYDPTHVAHRREIGSFFFQEVDRDKIVLSGEP